MNVQVRVMKQCPFALRGDISLPNFSGLHSYTPTLPSDNESMKLVILFVTLVDQGDEKIRRGVSGRMGGGDGHP